MAKFKPNESCHCGSGKKYKKCHGAVAETVSPKSSANPTSQAPELKGTWGLSGTEMILSILQFSTEDPNTPMNSAHPGGKEGLYKVEFVLSRPNSPTVADNQASFDLSKVTGDSHIFLEVPQKVGTDEEEYLVAIFESNLPEGNFLFTWLSKR